ncbi:MAG: protein-methionine-sulfoxide reductase heme-binding subunit MsrQ [Alphaproteobacteria bacterium]|nr:protein-methionine-sulfoxide reductase heme-binding subunit MsrQ [Alphaproteobacteria bacterium]
MFNLPAFFNPILRKVPTWPVYLLGVVPAVVYFYWAVTNQLGTDPLQMLERQLGRWALQLLMLTLLVTPVRKLTGISFLKFRRAFGLTAFFYVVFHLSTWLVLDKQFFWNEILADLYKRPYIILGMTGFLLLTPLALTSNKFSLRRMGPLGWNRLHRLSYLVVILGAVHFVLVRKVWESDPFLYLLIALILVSYRIPWKRLRRGGLSGAGISARGG